MIRSPYSYWVNESDSGVVRVLKYVGISVGLLLALILILAAFGKMEAVRLVFTGIASFVEAIWLWVTGLIGLIFGGIKKLGSFFGPGRVEKQVAAENEQIRSELVALRQEIALNQSFLSRERDLFDRERALFEARITQQEEEINSIRSGIAAMEESGPTEWFKDLSPEEQQQIIDRANQDVEPVTDSEEF